MADLAAPSIRSNRAHLQLLKELCEVGGISGAEGSVRDIVRRHVERLSDDIRTDSLGNLLVTKLGSGQKRARVMVAAHMDEVGFMITAIDQDGTLRFEAVGGIDARQIPGKPVWIGKDRIPGVIGLKPIHLSNSDERSRTVGLDSLRMDVGLASKETVMKMVKPGDPAVFATRFTRLGPTIRGKAIDNRLGVAALIELIEHAPPGVELLAAFTVQEEIGLRGAQLAAHSLDPALAIVVDCTPAHDLPCSNGEENTAYNSRMGDGPAIYLADRATVYDPRLVRLLAESARAERLPHQFRQPGGGGTDAGAIHLAREGIPAVSISVPGRYLHTAAGIASLRDWRATVVLVHAALCRLPELAGALSSR